MSSEARSSSGWRRLWVVSSGVIFLAFGIFGFMHIPAAKDVPHTRVYDSVSRDARAKLDNADAIPDSQAAMRVLMPNGYIAKVKERGERGADLPWLQEHPWLLEYQDALDHELRRDRLVFASKLLLTWASTCLVIYSLGAGVAWVRRGFAAQ